MDNKLVIVGRRHGSQVNEIISGPDISIPDQQEKFMPYRLAESNADFEFVGLYRLQVERQRRFEKPPTPPAKKKGRNEND